MVIHESLTGETRLNEYTWEAYRMDVLAYEFYVALSTK